MHCPGHDGLFPARATCVLHILFSFVDEDGLGFVFLVVLQANHCDLLRLHLFALFFEFFEIARLHPIKC